MFHTRRVIGRSVALLFTIGLVGGCVGVPEPRPDALDPRFAWPCDRLILTWSVKASVLQPLIGENVTQRSSDGAGELQLSVMRCDQPGTLHSRSSPLLFAYVTVPITADSAPLVVTNVPEDGWWALPHIVADPNTTALFARMGYDMIAAEMSFEVDATETETSLAVRLEFQSGHIHADATVAGDAIPHDASIALLENRGDALSAFFGDEKAQRYSPVSVTVEIEGDTPLSQLNLPTVPAIAIFDRALISDRILWRLPMAQLQKE